MEIENTTSALNRFIRFCLVNKLIVFLIVLAIVFGGMYYMPFDFGIKWMPRNPIPVDAIPDIGENQQIVFADWPGRSPQDVEDQVTYPLTVTLQGIPGVKNVRSLSMFGFSTVYVIFNDDIDFYWARSRLLERLNIAQERLPEGVVPVLGPDATGLGQIFWYTVEGEGFNLQELRTTQDWYIRYALQSVEGVSEVASIGGYVKEYQVDVDPVAMRAAGVSLPEVFEAIRRANIDIGAETIEHNGIEYVIRGKGFIKSLKDIDNILVKANSNVPIYIRNIAKVHLGPALRRGILDKEGAEAVGGVVVVRFGENPLVVIQRVKEKIKQIQPGLPRKTLADGRKTQMGIVPFYDRTGLIEETLDTLKDALLEEILICCFVVFMLLAHFRSNLMISLNIPLAVLVTFILMAFFKVDSNLMSLGGIAIAIGVMVDMGIVLSENIVRHFGIARPEEDPLEVIYRATCEVSGAITTAILITIISFLPIFALTGAEGKLFRPLAYTKTFAMFASIFVALTVLPALAHIILKKRRTSEMVKGAAYVGLILIGLPTAMFWHFWAGLPILLAGVLMLSEPYVPEYFRKKYAAAVSWMAALFVLALLTLHWMPLGLSTSLTKNLIFVFGINLAWTSLRLIFINWYPQLLSCFLKYKFRFLSIPLAMLVFGLMVWIGFEGVFGWIPKSLSKIGVSEKSIRETGAWSYLYHKFPGMGREFMPSLDEGAFLFMPTIMPHAGIGEAIDIVQKQDMAIRAIPEIETVVGKIGRAETALDPAPISMIETLITYKPEYGPPDPVTGERQRLWRDKIRTTDDIWKEITDAATIPGCTSAPKLQPIAARLVMLQSGMRAPMGVKVSGASLADIERTGYRIAEILKQSPGVNPETVQPDRVIGKPYLEINIDREKIAKYQLNIRDVQDVLEVAVGGIRATTTVEGRERYPVRVRYERELRDSPEALGKIIVPSSDGTQIPLSQLATINYVPGPQEIKSEDTFLVSYVLFDKLPGYAEVDVVEAAQQLLDAKQKSGELQYPAGTNAKFAGTYENQVSFQKQFVIILPICFLLIFLLIYFLFRNTTITTLIFVQISVGWAAGFIGLWLAAQPWFLDFAVFGHNLRELFHLREYNLSVAVWVGFIALFGIASDDSLIIVSYLEQMFAKTKVSTVAEIRSIVVEGGTKRVRPCLMTTATTVLALLPILTSTGKGADIMIPMALPIFFGMTLELITVFVTPVLYCMYKEYKFRKEIDGSQPPVVSRQASAVNGQ
ncbi:MAG TPA: acriflavine resistance protein B [Lentisphaeria bacterium]|nr:MAG: acriflavine resistance protein B [Lentisphaerae bacterium GWF2_50_93]HCE44931.1 acriflavine resistance protein B [Lentisphaeria bacterium]